MKPHIPDLLSSILSIADKTLDRPTGDPRRLDDINRLFDQAQIALAGATLHVNEWTLLLLRMLRKIEQHGPLGEAGDIERAMTVGLALKPYVANDCLAAHQAAAEPAATTDQDYFKTGRAS
jgi:hypothetical protein